MTQEEAWAALDRMALYPANWDSYGAAVVHPEAINAARFFTPVPGLEEVSATSRGGVYLAFASGLVCEIYSAGDEMGMETCWPHGLFLEEKAAAPSDGDGGRIDGEGNSPDAPGGIPS